MEKKFLTYSRRTTRPNGGIDPTVRELRNAARQYAVLDPAAEIHTTGRRPMCWALLQSNGTPDRGPSFSQPNSSRRPSS